MAAHQHASPEQCCFTGEGVGGGRVGCDAACSGLGTACSDGAGEVATLALEPLERERERKRERVRERHRVDTQTER